MNKSLEFDIVIVGSGAGGGTVAKELSALCHKGLRIALLELGPRFRPEDNTREELPMARQYYFNNGGFQTSTQDMTLAFAKGVGGSTNVYTGVTFKLPQSAVDKWNVPGINLDDLNPRMDKFYAEVGAHTEDEANINRNNQLFRKGCEKLGWHVDQFAINTRGCAGLGTCNLGCPRQAKQGTAVVQIPVAEKNGVEVIPNCRVDTIVHQNGADTTPVLNAEITAPTSGSSYPPGHYEIRASKVVLCAGAINTPALLMRSFGEDFNPVIGRYLSSHPALIMAGDHPQAVNGTQGQPKNYYSEEFVKQRFLLESCMYFPFSFARNLVGFGPQVDDFMHRYPHLQMILALILDDAKADNRVAIDKDGDPVVHYELDDTIRQRMVAASRASARLMFAAGAERVHCPGSRQFFIHAAQLNQIDQLIQADYFKFGQVTVASAHLMGGCRMGTDKHNSVTNNRGKLHDFENIYVADASLFPACAEVNPYLTIMALADRVAEGIRQELGYLDDHA